MSAWHLSPAELDAYAAERAGEVAAWSAEAHLIGCPSCRGRLAVVVGDGPLGAVVAGSRARAEAALDAASERRPGRAPGAVPGGRPRAIRSRLSPGAGGPVVAVTRMPWIWATLVVAGCCLAATWACVTAGVSLTGPGGGLLVLGPLAPIAGAATSALRRADPCAEVVTSTPRYGLALILRRCLQVLSAALPLTAAAAVSAGGAAALGMQTVAIAAVAATLALGSRFGVERAGAAVAILWSLGAVLPALTRRPAVALDDPRTSALALAVGLVAALAVAARRAEYAQLAAWRGSGSGRS